MKSGKAVFMAFLGGIIIGGALALLLTPYTGEEVRDRLKRESKKIADKIRDEIQNIVNRIEEDIVSIEEEEV